MIKILVAEDDSFKSRQLGVLLSSFPGLDFDIATDINTAKSYLASTQYDLLILDLCLPDRYGDDPKPDNSIMFIEAIERTRKIIKPFHIIGLTAFESLKDQFSSTFADHLWVLVHYKPESTAWEKQVGRKIEYLLNSKKQLATPNNQVYETDLCIITALRDPELTAVLDLSEFTPFKMNYDPTQYYRGKFEGKFSASVITASASQMGMVATTALSIKMISLFRPKYIAMVGIAGGVRGKGNFGDIVVAESAFDYGSGKLKADTEGRRLFEPDFRPIDITPELKQEMVSCKAERFTLDKIKESWRGTKPSSSLDLVVGPLGSGSGVLEFTETVSEIKQHSRKLVGVDMESYGLYYAANHCSHPRPAGFISVKSISDFADPEKSDDYQSYAAYTSAKFLFNFFTERFEIQ